MTSIQLYPTGQCVRLSSGSFLRPALKVENILHLLLHSLILDEGELDRG